MLLNQYMVLYYFFLFISLGLTGTALVAGLGAFRRLNTTDAPDLRFQLEKKLYLSAAAITLGAWVKIIGLPLYFLALHSLIPSIPGAMCLAGIHIAVPYYSWTATVFKLILPVFYITWIIFYSADKKIISQPFLSIRYGSLLPLCLLLLIESLVDFYFFYSLHPVKVVCCTAIFDFNQGTMAPIISENHWGFIFLFCLVFIIHNILVLTTRNNGGSFLAISVLSLALLGLMLLAQHTKLSPLLLQAPFHHCVFCLLAIKKSVLLGSSILLVGIYIGFSYGLLAWISWKKHVAANITPMLALCKRMVLVAINGGTALILASVVNHYL